MKFRFHAEVALGNDIDEVTVDFNAPAWPAAEQWVKTFLRQIGHPYSHLAPGYSITLAPERARAEEPTPTPDFRDQLSVEVVRHGDELPAHAVRLVVLEVEHPPGPFAGAKSVKDIVEYDLGLYTMEQVSRRMARHVNWADVAILLPDGFEMPKRLTRLDSKLLAVLRFKTL